jgi:7-cyano-7-deazaguanine synthase
LTILNVPVADLYGAHWSITGRDVPARGSPDQAVFLPGRNVLLLSKAALWCHLHGVPAVALGSLQTNPFPDATAGFFQDLQNVLNRAVDGHVRIELPFGAMSKKEVMNRGRGLPLQFTFSCIDPQGGRHCGVCNKCDERRQAFLISDIPDPTRYALMLTEGTNRKKTKR